MGAWRVIVTDTEGPTGVAPVCPSASTATHYIPEADEQDETGVYDCCPGPHIECWAPLAASIIATSLTGAGAEVCS